MTPTINRLIKNDPRLYDYRDRVRLARRALDLAGRGSQSRCAREIGLPHSSVNRVINRKRISLTVLTRIEGWLRREHLIPPLDQS